MKKTVDEVIQWKRGMGLVSGKVICQECLEEFSKFGYKLEKVLISE